MAETALQHPATGQARPRPPAPRPQRLHPLALRIMHWTNAVAIIIMIASGIKIYGDSPVFSWVSFPNALTLGGDPDTAFRLHGNFGQSGALQWHFLGMWIVVINGLAYLIYGIVTGRLRGMLLPIRPREVIVDGGVSLADHPVWIEGPHLFRKLGAQRMLKPGKVIIFSQKRDFKTRALEDKFRQLQPAGIRPLEFRKPAPAAPRKKTDSPF